MIVWSYGISFQTTSDGSTVDADDAWTYGTNVVKHDFSLDSSSSSSSSASGSVSTSVSNSVSTSLSSSSESASVSVSVSSSVSSSFSSSTSASVSTSISTSVSSSSVSRIPANWLSDWGKRIKITLDKDQIDDALSNFPVPIYLSASSGQSNDDVSAIFDELTSDANRFKIAVTDSDGDTQLYVEIERWDDANEKAWLHVKVPSISATVDGILYIYYDSSKSDNTTYVGDSGGTVAQNVWDSNFVGVWHMQGDPTGSNTILDSTSNDNDGNPWNMIAGNLVDAQFGSGLDFTVSSSFVTSGSDAELDNIALLTIESLVKQDSTSDTSLIAKGDNSYGWYLQLGSVITFNRAWSTTNGAWTAGSTTSGTWYGVSVTYSDSSTSNNPVIYLDGSSQTPTEASTPDGTVDSDAVQDVRIANNRLSNSNFDGIIDEIRISKVIRDAEWIKATYEGLLDNLLTFDSEESGSSSSVSVSTSVSTSVSISTSVSSSSVSTSVSVSVSGSASISSLSVSASTSISTSVSVSSSSASTSVSSSSSSESTSLSSSLSESVSTSASNSSSSLTSPGWLSGGWGNRIKITIDKDQIDETLTDFPIPIYLSALSGQTNIDVSCVFDELGSDANRKKIAVTRSDGTTECYVEIERWVDVDEEAWLHTKIHSVSDIQDGYLYLYYDSSHADNSTYVGDVGSTPGQTVWDSDFCLVAHLGEDPTGGSGCIKDSTSNGNDGTPNGTMTSGDLVDGQFGKCITFDGVDDYITHASLPNLDGHTKKTLECVANPQGDGGGQAGKLATKAVANVAGSYGWFFMIHSIYELAFTHTTSGDNGFWSANHTQGTWQSIAFTFDNTSLSNNPLIYVDGVSETVTEEVEPTGTYTDDSSYHFTIGGCVGDYDTPHDGPIDEVRYSKVIRSAAWIKATHKGLFDDLLIFSTEQSSASVSSSSESVSYSSSESVSESVSFSVSISGSVSTSSSSTSVSFSASVSVSTSFSSISSSSTSVSFSSSSESVSSSSSTSTSFSSSSVSSESISSSSISSESVSVSASSSSSSHDPIVHATTIEIEYTTFTHGYYGSVEASQMSLEYTTYTASYPLYGRMGQPIITGSKPKVICIGSGAYISCVGRDAKTLISGY